MRYDLLTYLFHHLADTGEQDNTLDPILDRAVNDGLLKAFGFFLIANRKDMS
jgi:hypothetical protein